MAKGDQRRLVKYIICLQTKDISAGRTKAFGGV